MLMTMAVMMVALLSYYRSCVVPITSPFLRKPRQAITRKPSAAAISSVHHNPLDDLPELTQRRLLKLFTEVKEAHLLTKTMKIFCWIPVHSDRLIKTAPHVKATWGRRCDQLVFMSTIEDASIGAVALHVSEGRRMLWMKTRAALRYIYAHYVHDYEWFLKADDDTYVVVENLRYLLKSYNASGLHYLGLRYKQFTKIGYMTGGASYVLSRGTVLKFNELEEQNPEACADQYSGEDVQLGRCLADLGVTFQDTRDSNGGERFFQFPPDKIFAADEPQSDYYYRPIQGLDRCSKSVVSFHKMSTVDLYVMDYLIYQVYPFGYLPSLNMSWAPDTFSQAELSDVQITEQNLAESSQKTVVPFLASERRQYSSRKSKIFAS